MKSDIERLMNERGLDALVVMGASSGNPNLFYSVSGAGLSTAVYIHRRGDPPHLVYNPMERDQARATGIDGSTFAENDMPRFQEESGGDGVKAQAAFLDHLLRKNAVSGRVGFYGTAEMSRIYPVLKRLTDIPGVELYEEFNGRSIFEEARLTKETFEVEHIRRAAASCFEAYDGIKREIRAGRLVNHELRRRDGSPVTISDLRSIVRMTFAKHGMIEDHASIIAQGVDGTAPHNHGTDGQVLREGASLVVDIFPRETGGGYFFDITRTFCVGAAPARLVEVYSQVKQVLFLALAELRIDERCVTYQEAACQRFEEMGYRTIRQDPRIESGYVHGLGHGVGLDLHEAPRLGGPVTNPDIIQPGMVFTIEPGLYFPEEAIAVRLEDMVWVRPDGNIENLSPYSYDLEIFPEG